MKNNYLKIILSLIIVIISIIFVIQTKDSNLEIFKNTSISDNSKIEKILYLLDYGKEKFTFDINKNSLNIKYSIESFNYKTLEKNASILFYLIDDLKIINYEIGEKNYSFVYDDISLIYNDFNDIDISIINERYNGENFSNLYLGNINGNVDIFDTSDLCLDNDFELLTTEEYVYYITCSEVDSIMVISSNKKYTLLSALENKIIKIDDLFKTNLQIGRRRIDNENFS